MRPVLWGLVASVCGLAIGIEGLNLALASTRTPNPNPPWILALIFIAGILFLFGLPVGALIDFIGGRKAKRQT